MRRNQAIRATFSVLIVVSVASLAWLSPSAWALRPDEKELVALLTNMISHINSHFSGPGRIVCDETGPVLGHEVSRDCEIVGDHTEKLDLWLRRYLTAAEAEPERADYKEVRSVQDVRVYVDFTNLFGDFHVHASASKANFLISVIMGGDAGTVDLAVSVVAAAHKALDVPSAEVHQVKITKHLTFSPLIMQMRSGERIKFCNDTGLYIKPYYFPFDGPQAPPNDLVRLGDVPPHQCMRTNPIVLPEDAPEGRAVNIFSEIQSQLKLIVGLYPAEPGSIPPMENNPYAQEPILGSWKGCDRIVKFSRKDELIVGHYVEVGDLKDYGFENNDLSHDLARSGEETYAGLIVRKKETAGGKDFRKTVITVQGGRAHDSGADSCGQNLIRISTQ